MKINVGINCLQGFILPFDFSSRNQAGLLYSPFLSLGNSVLVQSPRPWSRSCGLARKHICLTFLSKGDAALKKPERASNDCSHRCKERDNEISPKTVTAVPRLHCGTWEAGTWSCMQIVSDFSGSFLLGNFSQSTHFLCLKTSSLSKRACCRKIFRPCMSPPYKDSDA